MSLTRCRAGSGFEARRSACRMPPASRPATTRVHPPMADQEVGATVMLPEVVVIEMICREVGSVGICTEALPEVVCVSTAYGAPCNGTATTTLPEVTCTETRSGGWAKVRETDPDTLVAVT